MQERRFVRDGVGDEGFGHGAVFAEHKGLAAEDVHDAGKHAVSHDRHVQGNGLHAEH